jgi:hypothetical protein
VPGHVEELNPELHETLVPVVAVINVTGVVYEPQVVAKFAAIVAQSTMNCSLCNGPI